VENATDYVVCLRVQYIFLLSKYIKMNFMFMGPCILVILII